jgi:hypothetical protein
VVAVHRLVGDLEGGQMPVQRFEHELHHLLAVRPRVVLRPADRLDVVIEVRRALGEVSEVAVGQIDLLGVFLRQLDEVGADRVADAAAAGVQHHPDAPGFIEAHLDEVVAAAQRAELQRPVRVPADALADAGMPLQNFSEGLAETLRCVAARAALVVLREANRHVAADLVEHAFQAFLVEIVRLQRQPRGHHAAADVDPDRGRNDGAQRRDHRADRGAYAKVHVRHGRDMVVHDGQPREVDELGARRGLELAGVDPYRNAAFGDLLDDGHCA